MMSAEALGPTNVLAAGIGNARGVHTRFRIILEHLLLHFLHQVRRCLISEGVRETNHECDEEHMKPRERICMAICPLMNAMSDRK